MDSAKRVILNTSAQYIRTIISGILTLYSARIILHSLGSDDFGIYSLVAGVVMMLSFITNALSTTTQRYVSYYQGKGDIYQTKIVFCNSFFLHIGIGVLVVLLLFILYPFLYDIIAIPGDREYAASCVYFSVVAMLLISFIASPFRAILIAHENIVFISIIDVLDAIIKLLIAFSLSRISCDKLIYYGGMLAAIQLINLIAFAWYCFKNYVECVFPRFSYIDVNYLRGLSGFAGWSIYTIGCQIGRSQGINILLNRLLGTAVNAAYGLALQISSYANFLSDALINSIRPQIIKAEGSSERNRMIYLSEVACKYSFFLMSLVAIPCLFETPKLLSLWLGEYPDQTILLTRMYLLAMILDMLTLSFNIANQAIGKLKIYTICVNTGKLLTVPIAYFLLKLDFPLYSMAVCYIIIEFLSALIRLPIIKRQTGLTYDSYLSNVILRLLVPTVICIITCVFITKYLHSDYRLFLTFGVSTLFYSLSFFLIAMTKSERCRILNMLFRRTI